MSRKFSLAHLTVLGCAPAEMIYIAKMTGYDYVSIRPIKLGYDGETTYDLANDAQMLEETKRALKETGLKVHDIELAKIEKGRDVSEYEEAMKIGKKLGAKSILSSIWTEDKEFYMKQFAKLCDLAAKYDLTVDLEFVTWASVKDLKSVKEVLETVNKDNAGIMIDTLHFYRSRVQLEELDDIPKEWFNFVHICDGPAEIPDWDDEEALLKTGRDERLYVGEGEIDIASIINKLPEDIVYSIELPHVERAKEFGYAEHARRCIESSKKYLKEHLD